MVVYVLYEGDAWLSSSSLVPMGIFDSEEKVLKAAEILIRNTFSNEDDDSVDTMIEEFTNYGQTSGYDYCYMYKSVQMNKLEEF